MLEGEALRHIHNPLLCQEPSLVNDEITQRGFLPSEGKIMQVENPFLALPDTDDQRPDSHNLGAEMVRSRLHLSAPMKTIEDVNIRHASLSWSGEAEQDQHLDVDKLQHTLSKDQLIDVDKLQHTSSNSEGKTVNLPDSFSPPPTGEYEQPGQHSPTPEGEILGQSTTEDGQPNGNYKAKRPRPKDPLIEAVASHDKSMLRKVTDRFRPMIEPKVEERDSLLEQIRTKSFNLKRTVVTRTSIQGPKTNLKVVAILEKANAIRQALAGSDEDDEDNWSEA